MNKESRTVEQQQNSPTKSPPTTSEKPSETDAVLTADVETISELFSRGLDTWTDADMDRMIAELRKRRVEFIEESKTKKAKPAKAAKVDVKGKSAEEVMAQLGLDL